jgi:ankyrin repeat protein
MLVGGMGAMTPLEMSAQQGDSEMVTALLAAGTAIDEEDGENGFTALDWAIFKNDSKLAALLISAKADVNHADKLGYTPLHWAASLDFGDTGMLRLLLRSGADPRARTRAGLNATQLATQYEHSENQRVLETVLAR